jgi:hypothetical protein
MSQFIPKKKISGITSSSKSQKKTTSPSQNNKANLTYSPLSERIAHSAPSWLTLKKSRSKAKKRALNDFILQSLPVK